MQYLFPLLLFVQYDFYNIVLEIILLLGASYIS